MATGFLIRAEPVPWRWPAVRACSSIDNALTRSPEETFPGTECAYFILSDAGAVPLGTVTLVNKHRPYVAPAYRSCNEEPVVRKALGNERIEPPRSMDDAL